MRMRMIKVKMPTSAQRKKGDESQESQESLS